MSNISLFQNPFDCNIDDVPVELQLELIDLQETEEQRKCCEFNAANNEFSKKKFAFGMRTFSKMKYVKSSYQARLSYEHSNSNF